MYDKRFLPQRLKDARDYRSMTQFELARACKMHVSQIGHYEAGRVPSVPNLFKLAEALQVSVDYLLGRTIVKAVR